MDDAADGGGAAIGADPDILRELAVPFLAPPTATPAILRELFNAVVNRGANMQVDSTIHSDPKLFFENYVSSHLSQFPIMLMNSQRCRTSHPCCDLKD